jgi:DNA-binding transcriptional ArsR family regulator
MPSRIKPTTRFRAKIFKALSDPIRLEIIDFLRDGEKCVCEITPHLNLVQPLVSRHLKILKNAGLIKRRKESTWHHYSLTDKRILELIDKLTPELLESIKHRIIEQIA